ncbi:NAD-dependent epimerase/dehydratase family protein [Cupriavidus pauculus]|uniref:NAD-dependent epimerase/dehydratase family protein n=1 Tax=Cupriavidus pauculus TaxID=82633 RepID=UPI0012483AD0|nr:NAD-dependent epimerase/dehydratase family protein [Cupriavidus pauculus]KAB0604304.1 NAD-dependent epimerase/dehydratase family protein [Cupriavidus pauculus]MCM3606568.1 NAD-dependent epimerase/dehydratase family protein [Cupriavidus pauculus]UAL00653.1 NAD-dependent epimerase/dehydratase family protein [Cupriavidus pauculus]
MNQILSPQAALSSPRGVGHGRRGRRLGRPRLLIVGCGDVGTRILRLLATRMRVFAVTSQPSRRAELREAGAIPLVADLDRPATLARLSQLATRVMDLAPPPGQGNGDPRTRALLGALRRTAWRRARTTRFGVGVGEAAILPERGWHRAFEAAVRHRAAGAFVYASTTGVYGDRCGARVQEFHAVRPQTARARRRVAAEAAVRDFGRKAGWRVNIVRIPGIYAADRLPVARLNKGTPALAPQDDVYTSHIHADDLARTMIAALWRGRPQRVVHASDDTELRMADYFDLVADRKGLPRPPRISRQQALTTIDPTLLSFMSESRRLDNRRLKRELRLKLRYPTVASFFDR